MERITLIIFFFLGGSEICTDDIDGSVSEIEKPTVVVQPIEHIKNKVCVTVKNDTLETIKNMLYTKDE
ncbi:hypothetical protein Avbf_18420 [Armadillidium vulgare]|nr:hypothetical protein Avbf_18420 [Armadillidium vulgare]